MYLSSDQETTAEIIMDTLGEKKEMNKSNTLKNIVL